MSFQELYEHLNEDVLDNDLELASFGMDKYIERNLMRDLPEEGVNLTEEEIIQILSMLEQKIRAYVKKGKKEEYRPY